MKLTIEKYSLIVILVISLLLGMYISNKHYYYTSFENKYRVLFAILLILVVTSKVYLRPIKFQQLVALVPIIILYVISWCIIDFYLRFGIFTVATVCFLYVGTIILNSRSIIARVLFVMAFIVSSFNLSVILFYITERSAVSRPIINSIFISNSQEMAEYFYGNMSMAHVLVLVFFLLSATVLFYFRERKPQVRKPTIQLYLLFMLSFALSSFFGPLGAFATEYALYQQNKIQLRNMVEARANGLLENNFIITEKDGAQKIMVIIGESLTSDYMSLYGFDQNTNPHLEALASDTLEGRLTVFRDVISSEVTTVPSLRKVLTNINNRNNISFEESVSILDVFKRAGYETFWISSQKPLGKWDTQTSVIAFSADNVYFTSQDDTTKNNKISSGKYYDDYLLGITERYLAKSSNNKKQIYFIHLQGSHFSYVDRYPSSFEFFKTKKHIVGWYLNTVLYNDWVVANFLKIANENEVDIVTYFSDHGEDLEHLHNQENFRRGMVRIPYMIYLSNEYVENNKGLYSTLFKRKNIAGMTDNFFHDIQAISGVKSSLFDSTESFITDSYKVRKRRVVNNSIAYD